MKRRVALLCLLMLSAAPKPPEGEAARELVRLARTTLDNCGDGCRDLAADVWQVRKRLADKTELASMAVQVEQGDEACLCGKKNPTATALDRQAQLLAEAAVLFHRAGDADAAARNLGRLRNTAHAHPGNALILELLVRSAALLSGPEAAVRELSSVTDDRLRTHVLTHAPAARALPAATVRGVLTEATRSYLAMPPGPRVAMARPLFDRLRRAGMTTEAREVASTGPEREAWLKLLAEPVVPAGAPPVPESVRAALVPLDAVPSDLRAAAGRLAGLDGPAAAYLHESAGRAVAARDPALALALARQLRPATLRLAFATGAAKHLTDDRADFDDFLATHSMPE